MSARLDRLTLLQTFSRIVERGSISAAARDLGMSQASASRQLAQLEDRVGVPLLVRNTHALALTEPGRVVLDGARDLLMGWDDLLDRVRGEDGPLRGAIKVVAPVALGQLFLTRAMLAFQLEHPELDITWVLDDAELRFSEVGCDLWIRIGQPADDTLIAITEGRVERMIVAAPSLLEGKTLNVPGDLAALPALALSSFEGEDILLRSERDTFRLSADAVMATNNIFALYQAALQGVGYAVLPRWMVAKDLASGTLVDVLPGWRAPELDVTLCYTPASRTSRRLVAFREAMAAAVTKIEGIGPV